MAEIIVGGQTVLIDECDVEWAKEWSWRLHRSGHTTYVRGYHRKQRSRPLKAKYLHRMIMGEPEGLDVDHINGDGLDNRRSNLRACDRSRNNANRHRVQSKTSPIKGVHLDGHTGKWRAEIHWKGKRHTLGRYATLEAAAEAYAVKARELFGEFANPTAYG